ncbi:abortive infection family protein [Legionella geestiana]|uniref:abortive infection family protein n=1 Tax=Legionella geestiana TaxID=45065 RepID=UPI00048EE876|nr:abortive infection family protein [Legionella geestiana]QBS13529.1 abortive infection family protein [Legionella geestiana]STX59192.1 Uncharacterised protein [Legionella geestiana]
MSDLTAVDKRNLERLFGMASGYVLDFTDRTYRDFFADHQIDIDNEKFKSLGTSKANRLRVFWQVENNHTVGKIIEQMIMYGEETGCLFNENDVSSLKRDCLKISQRLKADLPVTEMGALTAISDDLDFNIVAQQVNDSIKKNQPEVGLDRLHTFIIKYIKTVCKPYGIEVPQTKALHSVFGEYVKALRANGHIETEMTERILKSSISVLEAFNHVRNDNSLAHDNPILNYEESLLIFNNISALVRFIKSIEHKIKIKDKKPVCEDIPF